MKKGILIAVMMFSTLFGLLGCVRESEAVTSVQGMTLTLRGMRGGSVYKIVNVSDGTELHLYREIYNGEQTLLELERSTSCDAHAMVELMNTCGVLRWDGFHGTHPKNVQDGIMFNFAATVNGDRTVTADGSANYPKGYHEFVRALNMMLAESETE